MKISVIGVGYVGLVTAACLAEMGNHVVGLDVDADKVAGLNAGIMPIFEPGLAELVRRNAAAGRLQFTTDVDASVAHGALQFIAVGTPPNEDGSADLDHVLAAARHIGERMTERKVIVDKSTVPVGTADQVRRTIQQALDARGVALDFAVAANPEFLKEGAAVDDFMRPDRVILGVDDEQTHRLLRALYTPFVRNRDRLLVMDVRSAEFTKYAANAMLATRISFMNELALLAEGLGADIEQVRKGMGTDPRIGSHYLYAGAGYGGSCFPKDVRALQHMGQQHGQPLRVLRAVESVNEAQKRVLLNKIVTRWGEDLGGKRLAVWGLSFKPGTDDMREAPSRVIIAALRARGAEICAYDPMAMAQAKECMPPEPGLTYAPNAMAALEGADAVVVVTEWKEFRSPDFEAMGQRLRQRIMFDGRNLFDPHLLQGLGFEYHAIGRRGGGHTGLSQP